MSKKRKYAEDPCEQFKQICGDEYDLSAEDWCEIPEKYYIAPNVLYQGQTQCHSLEFLIKFWNSQIDTLIYDVPTPMWPSDPYTRHPIPATTLFEWVTKWKELGNPIPEKLNKITDALYDGRINMTEIDVTKKDQLAELEGDNGKLKDILYPPQDLEQIERESQAIINIENKKAFVEVLNDLLTRPAFIVGNLLTAAEFETFVDSILQDWILEERLLIEEEWDFDDVNVIELISKIYPEPLLDMISSAKTDERDLTQSEKLKIRNNLLTWVPKIIQIIESDIDGRTYTIALQLIDSLNPYRLFLRTLSPIASIEESWNWLLKAIFDAIVDPGVFDPQSPINDVTEAFSNHLLIEIPGIRNPELFKSRIRNKLKSILERS